MSWTETDPGQGNPDGLLALAADLQSDADDAATAARMLRSVQNNASDAVWKGTSADAFRDRIDKVPGHLDKLNTSYADAAAGLRSYAASVRQIADDARVQQQDLQQSQANLSNAQSAQVAWTPPPHPATGQPDPTVPNPHDEQVSSANASIKRAQARLSDLAGQRKTADARLVGILHHAHSEGMQNKHWWQKALDFVSEALSKITIVLMVVALVAIVVLAIVQPELIPGLLLLAGQAMTALSAAQLAVDGARKASGENVSWGQLGMDALGALPGLGIAGDALKGGQLAERFASVLGKGGEFIRESAVVNGLRETVAGGRAFAGSMLHDLAEAASPATHIMPDGTVAMMRSGKGTEQMLSDARAAKTEASLDSRYSRPSGYRVGVRKQVWGNAKTASTDGRVRDPLTKKVMDEDKPWDMGHKPGHEFAKHKVSARARGITRKQFLNEHNDPSHYRPELPTSNQGHATEAPPGVYFGP